MVEEEYEVYILKKASKDKENIKQFPALKKNVDKSLYLIDDTAKRERENLLEKGFYNQIISSNATVSIQTDSINLDLNTKKFVYYGTQMINRKTSLIIRKLITQGYFKDIARTPNNAHGVLLENWNIVDNSEVAVKQKFN